jgi:hypothetical protein
MSGWLDAMEAPVPPPAELVQWAHAQPSSEAAWAACPRADWAAWLAAADSRNDEERRDVVAGAAGLAEPGGVGRRMFRLAPRPVDRARLWASPRPLDDIDAVVADWLHGVLLAAVVVLPHSRWRCARRTRARPDRFSPRI